MVRMADLPATKRESLAVHPAPQFDTEPWVNGGPLHTRTVTIVSTAGLILRGERPMTPRDARYRVIPHDAPQADVLMSHVSVNFDRTGWQRDPECVLPRRRLQELATAGVIGGVAANHYAFMGATEAKKLEPNARKLAGELQRTGVDTALLVPV